MTCPTEKAPSKAEVMATILAVPERCATARK